MYSVSQEVSGNSPLIYYTQHAEKREKNQTEYKEI